jgi:Tat protein translocase TatC
MSVLKVCLYAGLIFSFPIILYFIGEFIIPGLNQKEKKLIIPVVITSFLLFAGGVLFSYFVVIPRALEFFQQINERVEIDTELRFKYTVSFVTMLSLVFGLCFELPVVVMSLVKLDLLNSQMMRSTRSYAIVAMFVLAAIITPTPDIFTMSLLAGPMVLLYELCIWMAWWLERKTAKREALEKEEERKALVKSLEKQKQRDQAKDAERADGESTVSETREYDPDNEAVYRDETDSDGADENDAPKEDNAAFDEYHSGLQDSSTDIDPSSDAVWQNTGGGDSASDTGDDHSQHDADHDHHDPYHYDHGYHDDGYYSGPTEELKRSLHEDLKAEIKAELKAELKSELIEELKKSMDDEQQEDSS